MGKMTEMMDAKLGIQDSPELIADHKVYPFLEDKLFDWRSDVNKPKKQSLPPPPVPQPVEIKLKPVKKFSPRVKKIINHIDYYAQAKAERDLVDIPVENHYKIDWNKVKLLKSKNAVVF